MLLLLTHRHVVLAVLLLGAAAVVWLAAGLVDGRRLRRCRAQQVAAQQYAEQVLQEIFNEWVRAEVLRGQRDLERWRRTHRR